LKELAFILIATAAVVGVLLVFLYVGSKLREWFPPHANVQPFQVRLMDLVVSLFALGLLNSILLAEARPQWDDFGEFVFKRVAITFLMSAFSFGIAQDILR